MPNYSGIWTEQAVMQANGAGNWPNAPGAPTIGTATDTGAGGAVSVAFTAPTFAGIPATITGYTVTSSPGGVTGTGASSPITVSGLTNGTAYTFTVQATNASGTGPASAASNSVTPTLAVYVEDVYSTYLYTGNGSSITITNGIDLSTNGGLVWQKSRQDVGFYNVLFDTVTGVNKNLFSNTTNAQSTVTGNSVLSNGFVTGTNAGYTNENTYAFASWTFRKQPKFFDIVTYTGNSTARTIAHNLGSVPGCIIIKGTTGPASTQNWAVYHRSTGNTQALFLDLTQAPDVATNYWNDTTPTSTVFSLGAGASVNNNTTTYVAYLFAHDAGGFGATGTDNVISCGSFTTNASAKAVVDLGYEPQWILHKRNEAGEDWRIADNMRGWQSDGTFQRLEPNTSDAEANTTSNLGPTATGFETFGNAGASKTFIYIAIRRGPMRTPTVGTSVFSPIAVTNSAGSNNTTNFPVDLQINSLRSAGDHFAVDRLRGVSTTSTNIGSQLITNSTAAEAGSGAGSITRNWGNTGFQTSDEYGSLSTIYWNFKRAPGFFDEVCYTGNDTSGRAINHNLTVAPELMIVKGRSVATKWAVYCAPLGNTKAVYLNENSSIDTTNRWNNTTPTSSVFYVSNDIVVNDSAYTYVWYGFATCAGVSKVGSYTGTGTTQTINCGFTAGSRYILIKRTDSTGDWYVWDSARGIIAGNDPYLLLNSSAVEVTNTDYVDTAATGFEISSTAPAAINANGGTFIFLAIA